MYDLDVFDTFLVNTVNFNYKLHLESQATSLNREIVKVVDSGNRDLRESLEKCQQIEDFLLADWRKIEKKKRTEIAEITKLANRKSELNEPFVGLFEMPIQSENEDSGDKFNRKKANDSNHSEGEWRICCNQQKRNRMKRGRKTCRRAKSSFPQVRF